MLRVLCRNFLCEYLLNSISSWQQKLRAENTAPQVGSAILLFFFYLTDFKMVGYIPKMAFSSLLLLAFLDMMHTWLIKSYTRTKVSGVENLCKDFMSQRGSNFHLYPQEKLEWLVVPIIVVFAFVVGLLNAVFLGIAMSTFIFVATFFRSGGSDKVPAVTTCVSWHF